jgi:3-deoxy-manno-octulosonate cytidylyltransferase (CMP-KDO synthetase)
MSTEFHVIIPARYQSTRFPGKLLQQLHGVSILERVYQQAQLAHPKSITIATDSELIAEHAARFAASVEMTLPSHETGTDRIAEVIARGQFVTDDIIANVQGDEPFIAPELIVQVANSLRNTSAPIATLCWPIESLEQLCNPNVVKVVRTHDNHALYFSRSPIPLHRDNPQSLNHTYRHIGLYAYRAGFLLDYVSWPVCPLEQAEVLEQLRALWFGVEIKVDTACVEPLQDINTKEDLIKAQLVLDNTN